MEAVGQVETGEDGRQRQALEWQEDGHEDREQERQENEELQVLPLVAVSPIKPSAIP